jgi:hypothetical protein
VEPDNLRIHEVTPIATRPDNRQHGTGIVRAVALSLPFWIAAIWAIVHYAQKVGSPW